MIAERLGGLTTEETIECLMRAAAAVRELRVAMNAISHLNVDGIWPDGMFEVSQNSIATELGRHEERLRWERALGGETDVS